MQFHQLESLDPQTIQVQLIPAKHTVWRSGQVARFAIPKPELGPNSGQRVIAASSPDGFFFEFYLMNNDSEFIHALKSLQQGEIVYVKLEDDYYHLPEEGAWIVTQPMIGVARAYAKKYQATASEITIILYQTGKTYFADITRICGQNPQFTLLVANDLAELAFRLQSAKGSLTVVADEQDYVWLYKWCTEQAIDESSIRLISKK